MVAANLLRKTAAELLKLGKTSADLPLGGIIQKETKKTSPRFVALISIPAEFQTKKILNNPNVYKTPNKNSYVMRKYFKSSTPLEEMINTLNKFEKNIFGKYKRLDETSFNKLLKTKPYKNLKGKEAIAKQLDKDKFLTRGGNKFVLGAGKKQGLQGNRFDKLKIPKSNMGSTGRTGTESIRTKEKTKRMKKIASYIEKNPSLFIGTTREVERKVKLLADKLKTSLITTQTDIADLLIKSNNGPRMSVGQRGIKISKNLEKILEKIPKKSSFVNQLLTGAGYSKKTLKLKDNIETGLRQLGKNRKNFDHTLPMAVVKATNLPKSYKARGAHHSFAFNMAKKYYDRRLASLVAQRQDRVAGGKGLTASQYKKKVDELRKFFGEMTGGYKPGYVTIADDGTVTVKEAGVHFIRDKINDVGAEASGIFRYFENAKYHNALSENYRNPEIRNGIGREFFDSMERQMKSLDPDQLELFKTSDSLELGAVKAYNKIMSMKGGFNQENIMDLYIQNPDNLFFQTLGFGRFRGADITRSKFLAGGEKGKKFLQDILPRTYEDGGRVDMDKGGSVGIQPVASPTQKFDIQVKQMMETTGLDFSDSIIELMKDNAKREKLNIGGMVGNSQKGFALDDESLGNKVGALESLLAGIGAGLIDIPKGAVTLGASLMDVGFGTNNSAKMEAWFDDLTDWDEKAEQHWLGSFARIATNLGVPGAYGFKAGERLARNALLAKRNGNYFKLTDPVLQEKFKTSLNAKGRLLATLGGAAGVGATDAIFVGDPEGVGTMGDMIGMGPTQLDPNDANLASREIANRVKFGLDGALFLGLIGGTGSAIKSLARRRNDLASNNDAIDKFFSTLRPRGKKSQEFFDMERQNIGARAGDINFAGEQARKLDKHIDAIFPFVKNPFNKLGNKGRSEFMDKLNDTLLSGEIRMDATGKVNFGPMDKNLSDEIRKIMKGKNAKQEDIDGVFDSFEQMRLGWGHIFSRLGYSMDDAGRSEFRALFGNKFKSYLGSTYEIFQNKSLLPFLRYKPTEEAIEKTIKLFMDSASEAGKPITRGEAELFVDRAIETVKMPRDISTSKEKTTGIYFDAPEFFANKTVLDEIELGKKTVAFDDLAEDSKKIFAELFGKVSDPMQTMLTGTNRLSLIGRRNQFFNDLIKADEVLEPKRTEFFKNNPGKTLPKELRGFFRETEAEAVEAFGGNIKKIEIDPSRTIEAGITNPVNGKYAERGVAEALEEASQVAAAPSTLAQMYQSFILYPKATSQLAKTVLSPITHVRNFVSAGAFATANGLIPGLVSPDDFGKAFKEAFGQLQIPGARMDNERYRQLLRLGVVNSNVRLGDLQRLLKDTDFGESVNTTKVLRDLMRPFSKFKKFTEDMYTAEDDFWKLTSFALERQRLGRAYEKYGIAKTAGELDEEAADIIRNNIPNYDMVNDFIKATRKLPLGNFVSFPAEIMRTTANILNRSLKEINFEHTLSDGRVVKPLQGIGYKRLFGMGTTVVGVPYATSEAFKAIYDVTEDEMQALRRFVPDWSKNSTILPIRGDDGKLKYIDFSHANAYDTMIRPINSMIIGVQRGMEEGELGKEVLKSMYEGTKETLSPFFSESIWTNALSDIVIRNGRTREGRRLYTDQTPWGERVNKSILHLAETQFPGSIASFQRLDLAFEPVDIIKKGKFDEYGNTFSIPDEALGFIGMRAVEVDPVKAMKFKIADFRTGINNARREFTSPLLRGGPTNPQEIADRYQIASEALYNVQEKMFRDYFAAMQLGARVGQLDNEFADRVSNIQLRSIKRGEFKPFIPSENIEAAFAENARNIGQPNPYIQAKPFIRNLIKLYDGVPFGVGLPNIRNPFKQDRSLPIQNSPAFQGLSNPLQTNSFGALTPRNTQQTAIKGQQVFGATDPIFGS